MKLTKKQKAFADEYLANGLNATQAAIAAGYSENTANVIGCENLTKLNIKKYIEKRLSSIDKERIASQQEILEFFTDSMRNANTQKERRLAAEDLAKYYKLFTQNIEISGPNGGPIQQEVNLNNLTDEELDEIEHILNKITDNGTGKEGES